MLKTQRAYLRVGREHHAYKDVSLEKSVITLLLFISLQWKASGRKYWNWYWVVANISKYKKVVSLWLSLGTDLVYDIIIYRTLSDNSV